MSETLQKRAAAWHALCASQDEFVSRLLEDCETLEGEVDRLQQHPLASTPPSLTEGGTEDDLLRRSEQERRLQALEDEVGAFGAVNEELEHEAVERRRLIEERSAGLSNAQSRALEAPRHGSPPPSESQTDYEGPSFILCLINGSAVLFNQSLLSQGRTGGKDVAARLIWEIEKDLSGHDFERAGGDKPVRPTVLTLFFHDKVELVRQLLRTKVIASTETWEDFLVGFASAADNECVDVAGDAEPHIASLLLTLGYASNLKRIYVVGAQLDRLYEACPALLPSDVPFYVDVGPKLVLVNASETDDERDLLSTSGWRVTTFPRFFGTSLDNRPRSSFAELENLVSSVPAPAQPWVGAVKTKKPAAAPARPAKQPTEVTIRPRDRPVAAPEGADMVEFYASLTTPTSKHKFSPSARLLVQGAALPLSCRRSVPADPLDPRRPSALRLALLLQARLHAAALPQEPRVRLDEPGPPRPQEGGLDDQLQRADAHG
ncbi:hypothetical protein DMC30DRAFT_79581 [Rhodotorula diobovata]|uniref:DUF7923 domain-containing protein n=1 Tax=Rhodotorula diobovata TaxID=5288 RepID=A0A5C5FMK6_9BASI|nr:hypothetical protein DMC30DRAFT_79581 [Rhodotorula diobovata]